MQSEHPPTGRLLLRQALVVGSTMASFVVEDFSLDRLRRLTQEELAAYGRMLELGAQGARA